MIITCDDMTSISLYISSSKDRKGLKSEFLLDYEIQLESFIKLNIEKHFKKRIYFYQIIKNIIPSYLYFVIFSYTVRELEKSID